ncbi:Glutamyl-tRNA(Gln) amidotransferase subunit A [Paraburkholderia caffeinitolerans]|uniref:Glutamyl-tRNA(Gln) amidotransferase subunit A n=1 Tax=Paraburkholderia caffeinitolerans TaxID=1723730 RepID=A0A6J5FDG3_9BURK|nr:MULTISPECIES: amidase family protein [Paraburkholderia]CAB3777819.1 Glutamyl-tRNA(Gln) amidotransferase subunit A [Paraburkholderia caffeinitolerans]
MKASIEPGISVMEATVSGVHAAMQEGKLSARQLVQDHLDRIDAYDQRGPGIHSVLRLNPQALAEAARLDAQAAANPAAPLARLHGVPLLIKDNIECEGMETSAGARCLRGNVPAQDAFVVRKLREAGAIVLAKTNLHELASGGETVSTLGGQTLNPYDLTRTPGGSSGGTGAGIAASFGLLGIGTDGINSIRSPASANNLVGLRPTMGLVSRSGLVPCGLTQDTVGPITRTVTDAAIVLDIIAGHDPADPVTSAGAQHIAHSYADGLDAKALNGARIGLLRHFFGDGPEHGSVNAVMQQALETLKAQGAALIEIDDAIVPDVLLADTLVHLYEMKADLDAYLANAPADVQVRSLEDVVASASVHPSVERTLANAIALAGNAHDYRERLQRQQALREQILALMAARGLDALAFPHQRRLVVPIGESQAERNGVLASATGFPAIVIPAGFSAPEQHAPQGVPVGLELFGRPFSEALLIRLAYAAEQALGARKPPLATPALK